MPICKKCNCVFPNRVFIDGKQKAIGKRSYCLKCSPWGEKKGYDLRKQKNIENHDEKRCPICGKFFIWNKNNVCSTCRAKYIRYCQKKKAIELLGGECNFCGEKDLQILTFHHEDPENKSLELSASFGKIPWKRIELELKKCIILCANCHLKHHIHDRKINEIIAYYEKMRPSGETGKHTGQE